MAETAPLLFKKVLGSLRPVNQAATEALASLDGSTVRVRVTKTQGNTRRNGLYWAVLNVAAPMLSEKIEGDAMTVKMLHQVLKDRGGLYRTIILPSGEAFKDYDSISFATMPEPDRAKFIDWALATLSKWLGVEVADLRREGEAA